MVDRTVAPRAFDGGGSFGAAFAHHQRSALPGIESSGLWVSGSLLGAMASADFPRHFLRGISPGKNPLLPGTTAAFTSATEPFGFVVWCPLAASRPAFYAVSVRRPAGFL